MKFLTASNALAVLGKSMMSGLNRVLEMPTKSMKIKNSKEIMKFHDVYEILWWNSMTFMKFETKEMPLILSL